jgi:hypothetical protein
MLDLDDILSKIPTRTKSICSINDCEEDHYAKGLCLKHYRRSLSRGSPTIRTKFDPQEYIDCGDYYEIKLYDSKGNHKTSTKIDPEDVERCKITKWYLHSKGYVRSDDLGFLHNYILEISDPSLEGDHMHGDKLDNRKSQLRVCDQAQQIWNQKLHSNNTSGTKHVWWCRYKSKWCVEINARGVKYRKYFDDFEIAQAHAAQKVLELHGEYSRKISV